MLSAEQRSKLQTAYLAGTLRVHSMSPEGDIEWQRVLDVQRATTGPESIVAVNTLNGPLVVTFGHRVFQTSTRKVEAGKLTPEDFVLTSNGQVKVESVTTLESRDVMYDLTAEKWHNFVLHRSQVVVSNSPDRNYHFRPPAHEETVQQFNRVFGYIWENEELKEYIERSMDMIIAAPPRTPFANCDSFVQCRPEWRTLLLNGAMMHAIFAVMLNWISDEFDYSIGGVSLTIEKSSKYESAYTAMKDAWEQQLERAKQTVKIIKGLQQPRFGIGIRSSFGPHTGSGVLTPRKFVGF